MPDYTMYYESRYNTCQHVPETCIQRWYVSRGRYNYFTVKPQLK